MNPIPPPRQTRPSPSATQTPHRKESSVKASVRQPQRDTAPLSPHYDGCPSTNKEVPRSPPPHLVIEWAGSDHRPSRRSRLWVSTRGSLANRRRELAREGSQSLEGRDFGQTDGSCSTTRQVETRARAVGKPPLLPCKINIQRVDWDYHRHGTEPERRNQCENRFIASPGRHTGSRLCA